jgi:nucleoside-diphosphate-sugar epimerase
MRLLITGARSMLGRALAGALAARHELLTLDLPGTGALSYAGDLRERAFAAAAASCDAVVHIPHSAMPGAAPDQLLDSAARGTYNLLTTTQASRVVLISSLRMFERYPAAWQVSEYWAPQPTSAPEELAPFLAELTARELARVLPFKAIALRLGELVDGTGAAGSRALHLDDAVQAVERALAFQGAANDPPGGWWVFHISGAGPGVRFPLGLAAGPAFGYTPRHNLAGGAVPGSVEPPQPRAAPPPATGTPRCVVIYGAGGPLAAAAAEELAADHILRLSDVRPLEEIVAEGRRQSPYAPLPQLHGPPHETQVVDVADYAQVLAAARGMDAIVNCSVVRPHPVEAFRVNLLGAYNVMRAAVECGIRRVVHTGPFTVGLQHPAGFWYDWDLPDDVPARPGDQLYILSKFLGQEVCRIFAEEHALEVPALLFCLFVEPTSPPPDPPGLFPFAVSWQDAARAIRQALHAPALPRPFEPLHILADLPHGKYRNEKARRLLGWQPRDTLEQHYARDM